MDIQLKEDLIENQVNLLVAHDGVGVDIRRVECGLPERRAGRRRRGSLRPSSRTGRCGLRVRGRTSSRQTESAATGSAAIEVSAAGEQSLLLRGLQMGARSRQNASPGALAVRARRTARRRIGIS